MSNPHPAPLSIEPIVLALRARPLTIPAAASAPDFAAFEDWVHNLPVAERGPAWEAFTEAYLCQTPALDVKDVWRPADPYLPDDVLARLSLERRDVGQDFVLRLRSGQVWIAQAKFRSKGELLWDDVKGAVAAGRNADRVLFISNATALGGNCPPGLLNQHVGAVLRHDLLSLGRDFFERWEATRAGKSPAPVAAEGRREHQIAAVADVVAEFRRGSPRTQLIAACGTGKTRMALWTMEDLGAERAFFFAPSLALISQTVGEWTRHALAPIDVICVCSDPDAGDMNAYELAVPVTTNAQKLRAQWETPLEAGRRRVIFSTYHSAPVVCAALERTTAPTAELLVCDEAHRIAGDEDKAWQEVLDDSRIPALRRLFMTATQKLITEELKAAGVGASMDDEALFGRVAHRISFRDAINAGMLADYRIHVIGVATNERRVRDMVRRRKFILASDGSTYTPMLNGKKRPFDASEVAQAVALEQALDRGLFRYAFTFHSRVAYARRFLKLIELLWRPEMSRDTAFGVVIGEMPLRDRRALLERALQRPQAVIGSVQALSEGVDVPAVDAVVFADPKESVIAIVQAIGRALRKRPGTSAKTASIVIPVPVPIGEDPDRVINDSAWATVWNVLTAMSQHDGELAEYLADLKRDLGARRVPGRKSEHARAYVTDHISVELPDGQSFKLLRDAIDIAIVDRGTWAFWHMLSLFREWTESHEFTPIPPSYTNRFGERLGEWVCEMRAKAAAGALPDAHREALDVTPGWYWTDDDERWGHGFGRVRAYVDENGGVPVSAVLDRDDRRGFAIADWCRSQRQLVITGKQTPERTGKLRALAGWYEDEKAAEFDALVSLAESGIDRATRIGARVTVFLNTQRKLYARGRLSKARAQRIERLPGWTWTPRQDRDAAMLATAEAYTGDFTELALAVPKMLSHAERELRAWCMEQRRARRADPLDAEVEQRLAALRNWEWDPGLREFKRRAELLRPLIAEHYRGWLPKSYVAQDGTPLGGWLADQRAARRAGRLSAEKLAAIEALAGFDWDKGDLFAQNFALLRDFAEETGGAPVADTCTRFGVQLGQWAARLRQAYRSGQLKDAEQIRLLESVPGWDWTRLTDNQERMLTLLADYVTLSKGVLPPKDHVGPNGEQVGRWVASQVTAAERGRITRWLSDRLHQIPGWKEMRNPRAEALSTNGIELSPSAGG